MNRLKEELDQFWKWSNITAKEYQTGKNPRSNNGKDWMINYLYWDLLLEAVEQALTDLNQSWNDDLAELLVLAVSLDNGEILERCLERVKDIDRFMLCCVHADRNNSRLRIREKLNGILGGNHRSED